MKWTDLEIGFVVFCFFVAVATPTHEAFGQDRKALDFETIDDDLLDIGIEDAPDGTRGKAIAVQADGKVVVVGINGTGAGEQIIVCRLTKDGLLDATFNENGWAVLRPGSYKTRAFGVAVEEGTSEHHPKIMISGWVKANAGAEQKAHCMIGRLKQDGTLDETFNPRGPHPGFKYEMVDGDKRSFGQELAIGTSGEYTIVGQSAGGGGSDFFVARVDVTGTQFKAHRDETPEFDRAISLEMDGDDTLVVGVVGNPNTSAVLRKYNSSLTPVPLPAALPLGTKSWFVHKEKSTTQRSFVIPGNETLHVAGFDRKSMKHLKLDQDLKVKPNSEFDNPFERENKNTHAKGIAEFEDEYFAIVGHLLPRPNDGFNPTERDRRAFVFLVNNGGRSQFHAQLPVGDSKVMAKACAVHRYEQGEDSFDRLYVVVNYAVNLENNVWQPLLAIFDRYDREKNNLVLKSITFLPSP